MHPRPALPSDRAEPPSPPAAALEPELDRAITALSAGDHDALLAEVHRASLASGFTWERPTGGYDPVPLMLRPRVWTTRQAQFVREACLHVQSALARILPAWLENADVRALLPLTGYEEELVRKLALHPAQLQDPYLFARLDAIVDCASPTWDRTLAFLEPNVVGVGGTRYTALGELVWHQVVRPRLGTFEIRAPLDSRDLLLDALRDRARALRVPGVRLALVEDLRDTFGTNELRLIAEHFTRSGTVAHHVDVRSLSWRGEQLYAGEHPVDLVYRFPELRELEELDDGHNLTALWRAFAENRVVSTLGGDFDHKSTFELFTSPRFDRLFTADERQALGRHVLWTRLVSERKTEGPDGAAIDLVPFIRARRAELVLKPNRSYGGQGVTIGPDATAAEWDARLEQALAERGAWVVQAYRPLPRQPFPVWNGSAWEAEELAMVSGFYATARGVTSMGRVARTSVVNLTQKGSSLVPQVCVDG